MGKSKGAYNQDLEKKIQQINRVLSFYCKAGEFPRKHGKLF
jgi:hypothetical protein